MRLRLSLVLFAVAIAPGTALAEGLPFSRIEAALANHYPAYKVVEPRDVDFKRLTSQENYNNGVLVADFNSDGKTDIAAIVKRPIREDEKSEQGEAEREYDSGFQMAVVCNGQKEDSFSCSKLIEPEVTAIGGALDYVEWEWPGIRLVNGKEEVCREKIASRKEKKSLSHVKPYGYCKRFFYPIDSGEYKACEFCWVH